MKEKINLMAIIAALIILILGILMALLDVFVWHTASSIVLNIGCSLLASALVSLLTAFLVDRQTENPLDEWKLTKIYSTRSEKNADSDPQLEKIQYKVDAIAFGLKSFRTKQSKRVEGCLKRGVTFRIITMEPNSSFVSQREKEENESLGQIKHTIEDLIKWANELNSKNMKGKIIIKGYNSMTLDFYWRMDDEVFFGPYWYGISSQQTITYKCQKGGKAFNAYTEYFEQLWENPDLCKTLTQEVEIKKFRKRQNKQ